MIAFFNSLLSNLTFAVPMRKYTVQYILCHDFRISQLPYECYFIAFFVILIRSKSYQNIITIC